MRVTSEILPEARDAFQVGVLRLLWEALMAFLGRVLSGGGATGMTTTSACWRPSGARGECVVPLNRFVGGKWGKVWESGGGRGRGRARKAVLLLA